MEASQTSEFREWLRTRALAAGFARVGFASCEPFEGQRALLEAWIGEGRGTPLPWLKPSAMLDPAAVLPGCRTALVGFFPYARPEAVPGAAAGSLKLARYLWGPDYHTLLRARLDGLLTDARTRHPDLGGRVCVDTAPLMEKQLAVRAGLGWQGRNGLLIAGRAGSFGVLGVLLLDLALPPDPPFQGHRCGTCRACLEACPAGALESFRVDPRRCLSTYTLECEDPPPAKVAEALAAARWAAGCDACQEVCPWNRAPAWGDPSLWGQPGGLHDRPGPTLRVGVAGWRRCTRGTALRRVRHRHWCATLARILGPEAAATAP